MAKIIFVTGWLRDSLKSQNLDVSDLAVLDPSITIVSKQDVINYYVAQYGLAKLLTANSNDYMPQPLPLNAFYHTPEGLINVEVGLRINSLGIDKDANAMWNVVLPNVPVPMPDHFEYSSDTDGKIIYIIAKDSVADAVVHPDSTIATSILWNILRVAHSGVRVQDGFTDKCTVFRENPALSKLYVNNRVRL